MLRSRVGSPQEAAGSTPAAESLTKLGNDIHADGRPPTAAQTAEIARLQRRMVMGARTATITLTVALLTIAIGRYL
jgi:hypothetical protein